MSKLLNSILHISLGVVIGMYLIPKPPPPPRSGGLYLNYSKNFIE